MIARVSCDSLVALGNATADGSVLFAKNSDRPAAECQPLVQIARQTHCAGAPLRCQYIEIPQVAETAALIGSRPFWLWGFEHGLNEHGVAIGNHTVFTRDPLGAVGLTGMDLVRLGLERAPSAARAVEVVCALIEAHGQGGSGYFDKDWPYHNSFLIADRAQAFVLETSDRRWAVKQITDVGSASNHLTIGRDWSALSADAIDYAARQGWIENGAGARFDFAAAYRDIEVAPPVVSSGRHRRTCELLEKNRGAVSPSSLRTALRDHYDGTVHRPGRTIDDERYFSVCMHADPVGTTTASMVARMPSDETDLLRYWGSLGSPCTGVFLPYYLDGKIPAVLSLGGEHPSDDSPWWKLHELLILVERDFERFGPVVRAAWDRFESATLERAATIEAEALAERRAGRAKSASDLLTKLMEDNVRAMLSKAEELIEELKAARC